MDNTPTPPPSSTPAPQAPKQSVTPRPVVAAGSPATKPTFKPATSTSGSSLPPPPSFAKPQSSAAHAPSLGAASPIEMNFTDDDNKEPAALVAVDCLAMVASVAFAAMLVLEFMSLSGK